jgi:hypothetical protein
MDTLQTDDSQGDSRAGSSGDLDCSNFTTQEEAQGVLDEVPQIPTGSTENPKTASPARACTTGDRQRSVETFP